MKASKILCALGVLALAFLSGCLVSDYATRTGFPYKLYMLEVAYEPSPESAWRCARMGTAYGADLSTFDFKKQQQTNCVLLVSAERREDGSADVRLVSYTWQAKLFAHRVPTLHIPASRIVSMKEAS